MLVVRSRRQVRFDRDGRLVCGGSFSLFALIGGVIGLLLPGAGIGGVAPRLVGSFPTRLTVVSAKNIANVHVGSSAVKTLDVHPSCASGGCTANPSARPMIGSTKSYSTNSTWRSGRLAVGTPGGALRSQRAFTWMR